VHLVAVVSDTHMPARARALPADCVERLLRADLIVHAGDHADAASVAALQALGPPVVAVHGNVDTEEVRRLLPEVARVRVGTLEIGVVHDAGPAAGRLGRMRRRFPQAGLVIFGHSHIPLVERDAGGFTILNPGSPTDRRRQPVHTMAEVRVDDAGGVAVEVVTVGAP
jgi:uncharacterized protein